ncbi:hypothetical protein THRCLA_04926 [Thraustotheca clavata]|uniref:Transmembrane protein n=1 Tax=Thraustotheca clavata TaxID=74557 RepID=A0A1V9ZXL0_9STRA|nr:hypothetical protein THRCLA_04926 [Thraustotheca clavata]
MTKFHSPRPHHTNHRTNGPEFTIVYISKWVRITSNVIAGCIILATAIIVAFLLWKGMFQSRYVIAYPQSTQDSEWESFHSSCVLDQNGWIPNTCDQSEINLTGPTPWTSVGTEIASSLELKTNKSTAYVTTCLVGMDRGRVAVILLTADPSDGYAKCIPNGGQPATGVFVLETATTDNYPNGVFLLSSNSDSKHYPMSVCVQTDGTSVPIISFMKAFIAVNGSVAAAPDTTVNYYTQINSLNRRYLIWVTSSVHIIAIFDPTQYTGWTYGKYSGYIGTIGWVQQHTVDNHYELLHFQILITIISLGVLSNDAYVTFHGASGLLKNKPVLTYDVFSGLERRKALMCCLVATMCYSPLYADVLRYLYNMNGFGDKYWSLSLEMIAAMFAFSWIAFLSCWQRLPCPKFLYNKPLSYSAPIFIYSYLTIFLAIATIRRRGHLEASKFWTDADALLTIQVNGQPVLAGSYTADGTLPVINKLMLDVLITNFSAWFVSILANKFMLGYIYLDTTWTEKNEFLKMLDTPKPQWVTSLDLDGKNAIYIGDKLYCKPSMLALLGFCTILTKTKYAVSGGVVLPGTARKVEVQSNTHSSRAGNYSENTNAVSTQTQRETNQSVGNEDSNIHHVQTRKQPQPYLVISIYNLLPSIFFPKYRHHCYVPRILGTIEHNVYTPCKSSTKLENGMSYVYSRGDCCG